MTPEVSAAVEEIRQTFASHPVEVEEEAQGGAFVIVRNLDVGGRYAPATVWVGFLISFQYPTSDVYPHFTEASFGHADGTPLGVGFSVTPWRGEPAVQISRRSNRWNPAADTAAGKLLRVLQWMRSQ